MSYLKDKDYNPVAIALDLGGRAFKILMKTPLKLIYFFMWALVIAGLAHLVGII